MKLKSIQVCAVFGLLSSLLSSCGTSGDVVNPTIGQMDKLDTQWGLPPRQSKGTNPRRLAAPQELLNTAPANAPVYTPAPAPAQAPAPAAIPATSQPGATSVDPSVIQKLR